MDSYLRRFERYATAQKWKKEGWATSLSALLKGKALDVQSTLVISNSKGLTAKYPYLDISELRE